MNSLAQDVRFDLRRMRRSPGFVTTAVLTFAPEIGATTAIFTLVYQVIPRSLPVEHPEHFYKVGKTNEHCVDGGGPGDSRIFFLRPLQAVSRPHAATGGMTAVQAGVDTVSDHTEHDSSA